MPALFFVWELCLGGEQFVHRGAQGFGQVEGQGQGGVVFVVLNGVDGLAGDAAGFGQLLLGQAQGFPQGADLVVHSGTKFLGGHNDTLAGFLCTPIKALAEQIRYLFKTIGSGLSPFDSFLVLRGIKTLSVRVERQQENAMKIASWLKEQKKVTDVYYVGLPEHPGYEINQKQSRGAGSMISFRTDTEETARKVLERVKLISYAESLGGVESLITYPMLQTHGDVPVEIRERLGITETFLRLSVGIENVDDLIADLEQALA